MVAEWMIYSVLVSALLLGAGLLLEGAARRLHLAQRWVWAGVMMGSLVVPLLAWLRPAPRAATAGAAIGEPLAVAGPFDGTAATAATPWPDLFPAFADLDPLLLGLWGGASGCLLLLATLGALRLRRVMAGWPESAAAGTRVLVSEATGPAVVGFFPGSIVLPRWALTGDADLRRLMLAHEEEHLRARDPTLLLVGAAVCAALPWNLPLWWQLRRLRLTVEVDCDTRVLRGGFDVRAYATLLLEVGRRRAGLDPALVAFAEPASFLERRIRMMTRSREGRGWAAAAVLAALSCAVVAGACRVEQPAEPAAPLAAAPAEEGAPVPPVPDDPVATTPTAQDTQPAGEPTAQTGDEALEARANAGGGGIRAGAAGEREAGAPPSQSNPVRELPALPAGGVVSDTQPSFSPRDREPELQNRTEFSRQLEAAYPPLLKDAGVGGRVLVWVFVDATGRVTSTRIYESSGQPQLDAAATRVLRDHARFSPALLRDQPVAVWIALPVTFATTPGNPAFTPRESRPLNELPPRPALPLPQEPSAGVELSERPAFTPREHEPELQNRSEFAQTLARLYPADLRDAGIGGRALLWVFVTEEGRVGNVRIYESSGQQALDDAAVQAIRTARFTPAQNRGQPVPVWVALPVTFQRDG